MLPAGLGLAKKKKTFCWFKYLASLFLLHFGNLSFLPWNISRIESVKFGRETIWKLFFWWCKLFNTTGCWLEEYKWGFLNISHINQASFIILYLLGVHITFPEIRRWDNNVWRSSLLLANFFKPKAIFFKIPFYIHFLYATSISLIYHILFQDYRGQRHFVSVIKGSWAMKSVRWEFQAPPSSLGPETRSVASVCLSFLLAQPCTGNRIECRFSV